MAANTIARRYTFLGNILRASTSRNLTKPRRRISLSNPSSSSVCSDSSSLRQIRITVSPSRFLRRELSTLQPFYSAIASACLVSKLPADVTAFYEDLGTIRRRGEVIFSQGSHMKLIDREIDSLNY